MKIGWFFVLFAYEKFTSSLYVLDMTTLNSDYYDYYPLLPSSKDILHTLISCWVVWISHNAHGHYKLLLMTCTCAKPDELFCTLGYHKRVLSLWSGANSRNFLGIFMVHVYRSCPRSWCMGKIEMYHLSNTETPSFLLQFLHLMHFDVP